MNERDKSRYDSGIVGMCGRIDVSVVIYTCVVMLLSWSCAYEAADVERCQGSLCCCQKGVYILVKSTICVVVDAVGYKREEVVVLPVPNLFKPALLS